MTHFTKNKILHPVQHGFRAEHSCESQLLLTIKDLVQNYEDKIQTDWIVFNFSKAFDLFPTNVHYTNLIITELGDLHYFGLIWC